MKFLTAKPGVVCLHLPAWVAAILLNMAVVPLVEPQEMLAGRALGRTDSRDSKTIISGMSDKQ